MMHKFRLFEVQSASINSVFMPMESARRLLFLRLLDSVWVILIFYSLINYVIGAKVAFGALFIGSCNFYIYTTSLGFAHQISSEYYYLPTAILPFLLFESSKKKEIWGSVSVSFLLWVLSLVAGSAFFPHEWLAIDVPTTLLKHVNFLGAFTISLIFLSIFLQTTVRLKDLLLSQVELEAEALKRVAAELLRFKNVLDNMLDIIFMFEPAFLRFVYLNERAILSMGYSREELLWMTPYHIKPLLPEPKFRQVIAPLLSGEQSSISFDTVHRRKDGTEFPVNLVNNGIDAVKNQSEKWVKLNCYLEAEHVVLQVMDSWPGISESVELKMFEPFFTTKPVGEGTGLGLSITKGILDDHKAEIKLNRSYVNTCFEIRFPKAEAI